MDDPPLRIDQKKHHQSGANAQRIHSQTGTKNPILYRNFDDHFLRGFFGSGREQPIKTLA
jgi:hypothetical protein